MGMFSHPDKRNPIFASGELILSGIVHCFSLSQSVFCLTQTPQKAQKSRSSELYLAQNSRNSQSTHRKLACVGIRRRRECASVCDEGSFRFPEECSLLLNLLRRSSTSGASALLRQSADDCVQ